MLERATLPERTDMAKRSTRKSSRKTARKAARKTARKTTRTAGRKAARKTARKGARKSARRPNAAFMRPVTPSPQLAEVVGEKPIPRTEVTKRLWAYIKRKGLQDTQNKRMINADDTLRPVLGGKSSVSMFEMTRLVNQHLS
jgi:chromatin remodeling complex protein RSC6